MLATLTVMGNTGCGAALLLALALAGLASCAPPPRESALPLPAAPAVSLLAVGDTGHVPRYGTLFQRQRAVARAMVQEDQRAPVRALVLLGDNFYPDGLREHELARRLRLNVVGPYCHFAALDAPRSDEVAQACRSGGAAAERTRIFGVLGNHDYGAPESPRLQAEAIPDYVSNWSLPAELAATHTIVPGLDLVLLDSEALRAGADPAPLERALRAARGPWRILAAHHPIVPAKDDSPAEAAQRTRYRELVLGAIRAAGAPVQLVLSGNEHNLQLIETGAPEAPLQVVAGSGSEVRPLQTSWPGTRFALAALGFARVDWLEPRRAGARLRVTLFRTGSRVYRASGAEPVAAISVSREGELRDG